MRHTSPNPTLTSDLLRAVPSVKKDGLEKALVAALLRCSQGLGVKSLVDLLLLLVADQPYVQRFLICAVKEGRGRLPPCSPEDLQRFTDKVLMGLSNHHISQVYGGLDVCSNSEKSCEDNLTFPAISVAEMLHKGTIFRASKGQPKGVTVMTRAEKGILFFPTGCTTVDRLLAGSCSDASDDALEGGVRAGLLTEVHGEAGSGKTQLMLQCLLQSVARYQCALCISLLQPTLIRARESLW
ncbi:unnamed protein product [Trypanosoma congolense IL3000]|uniref:WGS project CAEQ00000000 data, annotated contig 1179 n=1 Tax=Trypanosoma congolense (strain IL3000) TaxID=1068625 RepID=F9W4G7_TRYCI|nr:unnamed protein product [Trypanosoma congolense IL3000]